MPNEGFLPQISQTDAMVNFSFSKPQPIAAAL
jgi:hypothetical protein